MIDSAARTDLLEHLQAEVHVWYCRPEIIQDEDRQSAYESVLSPGELERYQQFHYDKDKHAYLVAHTLLRHALSRYMDVPASQWQFSTGEHGKPELILPPDSPGMRFNLTHTDGLCACIIALNRSCGIDAENIHRKNKLHAIARRMFAPEELAQLDSENMQQRFYYYWTLREAYVKALGTGLAGSSQDYYFDIDSDHQEVEIHHKKSQKMNEAWRFGMYRPTDDHVLSVAFEAQESLIVKVSELIP